MIRLFSSLTVLLFLAQNLIAGTPNPHQPYRFTENESFANTGGDTTRSEEGFHFPRLTEYFITDTFPSANFFNNSVDIFRADLTKLKDTFLVVFKDSINNVEFQFPIKGKVSSRFGPRNMYGSRFHYGTDIMLNTGDTIVAAMDGVVRVVRFDRYGYGYYVMVAHKNGLETLYGHLSRQLVKVGDEVKAGDILGLGGSTGRSTGPHLHFEFRFMGEQFDPEHVCSFENGAMHCHSKVIDQSVFKHLKEMEVQRTTAVYHTVRQGNTLSYIAQKYNTSVRNICALNGISTKTILKIGRNLRVR